MSFKLSIVSLYKEPEIIDNKNENLIKKFFTNRGVFSVGDKINIDNINDRIFIIDNFYKNSKDSFI